MSPALYAFLASSGPVGVSRAAVARWAQQHGRSPHTVLRALDRSARTGRLHQRLTIGRTRVAVSVIYVVPASRGDLREKHQHEGVPA